MALTVGELVGYIRLDDTGWNNRLQASQKGFEALGSAVKAGTVAMATSFTAVTAATVGLGIAAFNVGANYNILQQSSRAALSTLLGGAEAANVQMDKLDAFARTSPFAKQVFITAQQQLLGFGVQAERVIPILDAVQNAVAAVGGNNDQVSQVTYALAQMQGQGKLTGETLNQLGQYGIDAAGILGEEFGKTGAEIRKLASEPGGIPVAEIWDPLVEGLMERFGGATAAIKEQFVGATDRIKGAWRDIGSILATPFIDPHGGGMAVVWANQVADALRALEQKAKPLVDLLLLRFKPGLDAIGPALERVKSGVNSLDLSKVNSGLDTLVKYAPLVAGVTSSLIALGGPALLGPLGAFLPAINPVVAGIGALIAFTPGMREVGSTLADSLRPVAPIARELGTTLLDTVMDVLAELVPALGDVAEAVGPLAMALASGLAPAAISTIEALVPIASVVADVVTWMAELPTPVLAAALAFGVLQAVGVAGMLTSMIGVVQRLGAAFAAQAVGTRLSALAVGEFRLALSGVGGAARSAGTALLGAFGGPVGLAIIGVSLAFGALINSQMKAKQFTDDLAASLDEVTGSVTRATKEIIVSKLATENGFWNDRRGHSPLEDAKEVGLAFDLIRDAAMGNTDAMKAVTEAEAEYWANFKGDMDAKDAAEAKWRNVNNAIKDNAGSLEEAIEKEGLKREAMGETSDAIDKATEKTELWTAALSENTTAALDNAGGVLSAKEAALRYQEALVSTSGKIADNNKVIAENTEALNSGKLSAEQAVEATAKVEAAQRANEEATVSLTRAGLAQIEANAKNNASGDELRAQMETLRQEVINSRIAMGESAAQAANYANSLGLIPHNVLTTIEAKDLATGVLTNVVRQLNDFNGKTYTAIARVDTMGNTQSVTFPGSGLTMKADGGIVQAYEAGGIAGDGNVVDRVSQIAAGGRNILWAEPSTGWEAYISGKPDQRNRNLQILDETARRLGRITLPAGTKQYASGNVTPVPAAASSELPPIYIQNPFTGEYLLAQVNERAAAAIRERDRDLSGRRGYMG